MTGYTRTGQQILHRGAPFARAVDDVAAMMVLNALRAVEDAATAPVRDTAQREFQWGECHAYQASDQMLCRCGLAWDVNDPDPPVCVHRAPD